MVNTLLKSSLPAVVACGRPAIFGEKPGLSNVNEFLSNRFEFSENSRRILIECAQNREQRLQPCLLACVMRRHNSRPEAASMALSETKQRTRTGPCSSCCASHSG